MGHKRESEKEENGGKKGKGSSKEHHHGKKVELKFTAPDAQEVFVAGDFNGWDPRSLPMKRHKGGTWKVKLRLPPGRYEYKFLVDGKWIENLQGVEKAPNPYGTENIVLWVE